MANGRAGGRGEASSRLGPEPEPGAVLPGGRRAAEARLARIDPARYGASRNHLDGAVTRLSPYIRHGVLTLAEVREAVFAKLRERGGPPTGDLGPGARQGELFPPAAGEGGWSPAQRRAGEKLIAELGWRDYWQRLWRQWGDGIWHDREPLKTGHAPASYANRLPEDLAAASTGLACMDAFAAELMATGWLHNHARMWLAAYVVHWRRVRWQAGARWFLSHLLDGDPASNNLGWQWVASAFSHKPYLFNRANLERFGGGRFCDRCPAAGRGGALVAGGCPFEASYEVLGERLFRSAPGAAPPGEPGAPPPPPPPVVPANVGPPPRRPLVWVHGEALGPANPALRAHPEAPAVFVFDGELIAGRTATTSDPSGDEAAPLAPGRLRFLRECLAELPVEVREGDVAAELLAAAVAAGADGIVTSQAVDPRFAAIRQRLDQALPLWVLEPEPFVDLPPRGPGAPDLRRFSRYWRKAEPRVWGERG
ncbi:MAG: FAD-binding domain-containing protein [Cyanobacteriota bacterium]|nr:FAD-binding domain-containing protein [Cyanobacteriota bacterium]